MDKSEEEVPFISDKWIAARWPEADADEVRRRFYALMDKIGETPWRGIPCFPDLMVEILSWAALIPAQRIEILTEALSNVPEHLRQYKWVAEKPYFGEQRVKYEYVIGDNGHGMGRQAIASTPYIKGYNLAPWIAAASPGNIAALLSEITRLQSENAALRDALESALITLDGTIEYHAQGMGCGLEDRSITDRYEAMEYGWNVAIYRAYDELVIPVIERLGAALAAGGK